MSIRIRDSVASLPDYSEADLRDAGIRIRMHRNECPIPPPSHVLDAIRNVPADVLRTYPAELGIEVRELLAARLGVDAEMLLLTSGADEALAAIGTAFADESTRIVTASPTFGMYARIAAVAGAELRRIRYRKRWALDLDEMAAAAAGTNVLILGQPNNPTGECLQRAGVERIAAEQPETLIVIDEVYLAFSPESLVSLAERFENVVVIGSLSKTASLAGTRVGYAVAQPAALSAMRRVLGPYPVSSLSLVAARAYLSDREQTARFEASLRATIAQSLDAIVTALAPITESIWRGPANFALVDSGTKRDAIVASLRARGIAVRAFDDIDLNTCLRICAGNDAGTAEFIDAYRAAHAACQGDYAVA